MPDFTQVNWLAVVIAAVAGIVIGFVWYMPQVFGRRWAAAAGIELPEPGDVSPMVYLGSVVQALLTAYVIGLFAGGAGIVNGLIIAGLAWLGFVATVTFNAVLFERRSLEYWLINAGYALVALLVMGGIVGYFPATL